jgi:hypothetical protein
MMGLQVISTNDSKNFMVASLYKEHQAVSALFADNIGNILLA